MPKAVLQEPSGHDDADINAQRVSALVVLQESLRGPSEEHGSTGESIATHGLRRVVVTTGNAVIDQFEPGYFGIALACRTCPDLQNTNVSGRRQTLPVRSRLYG